MDEPFSALDPITRRELQDELGRLQARLAKMKIVAPFDGVVGLKQLSVGRYVEPNVWFAYNAA